MIGNDALGVDTTIYGLLLILFIIFMPKGILGAFLDRFRARPQARPSP
jgi:branched-chain amino acid transport system permease protein